MDFEQFFIKKTAEMHERMAQPAIVTGHIGPSTLAAPETATFLWDSTDADSDVVLARTVNYNAALSMMDATVFSANNPTVTTVTTDQATNTDVSLSGTTVLTITGTLFGAEDADIKVLVHVQPKNRRLNGPLLGRGPKRGRYPVEATITAIDMADEIITASLVIPASNGRREAQVGVCEVEVINTKRFLTSSPWSGLTVV